MLDFVKSKIKVRESSMGDGRLIYVSCVIVNFIQNVKCLCLWLGSAIKNKLIPKSSNSKLCNPESDWTRVDFKPIQI